MQVNVCTCMCVYVYVYIHVELKWERTVRANISELTKGAGISAFLLSFVC